MTNREWKKIEGFDFKDILFEEYNQDNDKPSTLPQRLHAAHGVGDEPGVHLLP